MDDDDRDLVAEGKRKPSKRRAKSIPSDEYDELRGIKDGITSGAVGGRLYNNAGGHGGTILPTPGRGQEYREYDLGTDRDGGRGRHRVVILIGSDGKSYEIMYYTDNHYTTFEELID